jgi:hypothetical protein
MAVIITPRKPRPETLCSFGQSDYRTCAELGLRMYGNCFNQALGAFGLLLGIVSELPNNLVPYSTPFRAECPDGWR